MSHLIEEGWFDCLEIFFLIAGHTHGPIDQWFSVISRCIRSSDFVGSTLAMQELFKYATTSEFNREPTVLSLNIYHDMRKFYKPVLTDTIKNYLFPHRFIIERHEAYGVAYTRHQGFTPAASWDNKWLPRKPPVALDTTDKQADIPLSKYMLFNGEENVLEARPTSKISHQCQCW